MIRALILPAVAASLMSSVFFLPKAGQVAESAIQMELPAQLGEWRFHKVNPSTEEVRILAKDTDFSKAVCIAPMAGAYALDGRQLGQRLDLSVVLSGSDINNSIHRPERCMPAQGHQIYETSLDSVTTPDGHVLPASRLISNQTITLDEKGTKKSLHCVTYYFFVGQRSVTSKHLDRTLIDMQDRVFRGQDQRWAYVSASMWFTESGEEGLPSREHAEKEIRQFLGDLADRNIDWQRIKNP